MIPSLLLNKWREAVIGGLVLAALVLALQWKKADSALKTARAVYENPAVKTVERVVYKTGPVRIRTVIKEIPGGAKETVVEETRGADSHEIVNARESAPVPTSMVLAPTRTDRYLLTLGVNRFSRDTAGKALFVGYGWKNRFDLQVGAVQHDGTSPWVLATLRF